MDYQVISNFLPEEDFKSLYELFYGEGSSTFLWRYQSTIASTTDSSGFYFENSTHFWPVIQEIKEIDLDHIMKAVPLLYYGRIFYSNLLRVKFNCFTKQCKPTISGIHTDYEFPHKVLLYSINTNNGATILDPLNKDIKIPSIENQALIFDGQIPHQAITQTDEDLRVNINICYTI